VDKAKGLRGMSTIIDREVLIIGGGPAGLSLACALGGVGIPVAVVDAAAPPTQLLPAFDGRTIALSLASRRVTEQIGIWDDIAPSATAILDIRIADDHQPVFLHFDHREVGDAPFGWIVENRHIRSALFARIAALADTVSHLAPMKVVTISTNADAVTATLADGRLIRAKVLVGADGRGSYVRRSMGIEVIRWAYEQEALVTAVTHPESHQGIAIEHFRPGGPFAVLPMADVVPGVHSSSIVWTHRPAITRHLMSMDLAAFEARIQHEFGDFWGPIRVRTDFGGARRGRFSYPLSLLHAKEYVRSRLALGGDAAHGIHPIAGQGFNLGVRDIAALAEVIHDAALIGRDIGELDVLRRYERWRRPDNVAMALGTDLLDRLFSNSIPPIRCARAFGLGVVQQTPPLKRFFMRYAMGTTGVAPRMVSGEPL
jgi:2-octaprenyl-6-methoxyphenol hydroxylase